MIRIGDAVRVTGINCHQLFQAFGECFYNPDRINAQQKYLGCVGTVTRTPISAHNSLRGYIVEFTNGESILVVDGDIVPAADALTTEFEHEVNKPFTNDEKELLDKVIVALSHAPSKFADAAAIVDMAVDIVVERTRVYNKAHLRN